MNLLRTEIEVLACTNKHTHTAFTFAHVVHFGKQNNNTTTVTLVVGAVGAALLCSLTLYMHTSVYDFRKETETTTTINTGDDGKRRKHVCECFWTMNLTLFPHAISRFRRLQLYTIILHLHTHTNIHR